LELQTENNVPSSDLENKSKEEIIMLAPNEQEDAQKSLQCDDNQNNVNNRMLLMQNFNINAAGERILVNLKQLLALYAKLKRQLVEFTEVKTNEHSSYKAKCDEMSSQVCNKGVANEEAFYNIFLSFADHVIENGLGWTSHAGGV
jgi:hypothetical protein